MRGSWCRLMNRTRGVGFKDGLGAVAVMDVEIDDGDFARRRDAAEDIGRRWRCWRTGKTPSADPARHDAPAGGRRRRRAALFPLITASQQCSSAPTASRAMSKLCPHDRRIALIQHPAADLADVADVVDVFLRMNEPEPFFVGRRGFGQFQQACAGTGGNAPKSSRKFGKRIGRIDQPRLANRLCDRADSIRPLGMMRAGHVVDEVRR